MRVYYRQLHDTEPTFFAPDDTQSIRPDEQFFIHPQDTTESPKLYHITWAGDVPTLVRNANADEVIAQDQKDANAEAAKNTQDAALRELELSKLRKANKLPALMSDDDELSITSHIQLLQGEVDNPTDDPVYHPPLPPGVTPPAYKSFTVTVVREAGWQGALGFKVTLESQDPSFSPDQMALAVYGSPDCQDYQYTTGAFVNTDGVWGAVCPAGHEPGDVDVNFGILYGATPMTCWMMPQGQATQTVNAYEEI